MWQKFTWNNKTKKNYFHLSWTECQFVFKPKHFYIFISIASNSYTGSDKVLLFNHFAQIKINFKNTKHGKSCFPCFIWTKLFAMFFFFVQKINFLIIENENNLSYFDLKLCKNAIFQYIIF